MKKGLICSRVEINLAGFMSNSEYGHIPAIHLFLHIKMRFATYQDSIPAKIMLPETIPDTNDFCMQFELRSKPKWSSKINCNNSSHIRRIHTMSDNMMLPLVTLHIVENASFASWFWCENYHICIFVCYCRFSANSSTFMVFFILEFCFSSILFVKTIFSCAYVSPTLTHFDRACIGCVQARSMYGKSKQLQAYEERESFPRIRIENCMRSISD